MKKNNKKYAFSLAEALITLLIVSIVAVASAPIITKKARKTPELNIWTLVNNQGYIYPANGRDLMLGSEKKEVGIIVNGVLVFKDKKGKVIGWIAEDGSSSFSQPAQPAQTLSSISPEELDRMVKMVTESMTRQNIDPTAIKEKTMTKSYGVRQNNQTAQTSQQEDLNKQMNDMSKSLNIDLGSLLQGLQQQNQ